MTKALFVCHGSPFWNNKKHWDKVIYNDLGSNFQKFTTDLQQLTKEKTDPHHERNIVILSTVGSITFSFFALN